MSGDDMAFPLPETDGNYFVPGLTKRELFAAMAMQGLCAARASTLLLPSDVAIIAGSAVRAADALLAALERQP